MGLGDLVSWIVGDHLVWLFAHAVRLGCRLDARSRWVGRGLPGSGASQGCGASSGLPAAAAVGLGSTCFRNIHGSPPTDGHTCLMGLGVYREDEGWAGTKSDHYSHLWWVCDPSYVARCVAGPIQSFETHHIIAGFALEVNQLTFPPESDKIWLFDNGSRLPDLSSLRLRSSGMSKAYLFCCSPARCSDGAPADLP
jgi:hypothetical protein